MKWLKELFGGGNASDAATDAPQEEIVESTPEQEEPMAPTEPEAPAAAEEAPVSPAEM